MNFAKELQLILQSLGIAHANMEKGEMRVEANISVSINETMGSKVEVKNLNSFRVVGKAIDFEFKRQVSLLEKGEEVLQETRGWDEKKEETFSQRKKEASHDYRYFPDPDLPKLFLREMPELEEGELKKSLPELPSEKRARYKSKFGLKEEDIEIFVRSPEWGSYFEEVSALLGTKEQFQIASNYITTDLKKRIDPSSLAELVRMFEKKEISSRAAKDILKIVESAEMNASEEENNPRKIAERENLMQISDKEELRKYVIEVLAENKNAPTPYLVGQVLKKSEGRANPVITQELVVEMLDG